ncbi:MAG: hypothetical protein IJK61_03040 [Bacteroidetes bacterium]|nr:hypothetical protein [Bacteroidota bacterium]
MMFRKLILMLSLIFFLNSCTYYNVYREMKEGYEEFNEDMRDFDSLYNYKKNQSVQEKYKEKNQQDNNINDTLNLDTTASKHNFTF